MARDLFQEAGISIGTGEGRDLFAEAGIQFEPQKKRRRDVPEDEPAPKRTVGDVLKDAGVTALKGAVGLPQAYAGLADIVTLGRVGKALEELGYRPEEAQKILDSWYSPAQQAANRNVREAEGFFGTIDAAIENPSVIATTVGEAIPQTLGGAAIARGLIGATAGKVAPWVAGGIGEGVIGAGAAASQIRSETEDGLLTPKQAGAAVASGAGTAVLGAAGGKIAQRMGVPDVDTMLATGKLAKSPAGSVKAVGGAGLSEGAFEGQQSGQEQMWQNWALGKPLMEGVDQAAALGMLSGMAMGGAGGGYNAVMARQEPPADEPAPPATPPAPVDAAGAASTPSTPSTTAAAPAASAPAPSPAPAADPTARLAELEILAEQRDLTPAEREEAAKLLATLSQDDALAEAGASQAPAAREVDPIQQELDYIDTRLDVITPANGYGPVFDHEREELAARRRELLEQQRAAQAQPAVGPSAAEPATEPAAEPAAEPTAAGAQGAGVEGPAPVEIRPRSRDGSVSVAPQAPDGRLTRQVRTEPAGTDAQPAQSGTAAQGAAGSRPTQVASDFWSFAKSKGFTPGQIKVGTPEHAALKAEYDALKVGKAEPILPPLQPQPSVDLQNRDRSRAASVVQMSDIARNPDYMRLGPSRTPDSGAPMVFAVGDQLDAIAPENFGRQDVAVMSDGQRVPFRYAVVDATKVNPSNFADGRLNPEFSSTTPGTIKALNNGRTAGVRAAHEMGTAGEYVAGMQADEAMHGIPADVIARTPNPMLVRVYSDAANTANMAAKSQGQGLGMSPAELARQDAPLMDSSVLGVYVPGEITSAANRDFVRAFIGKLLAAGQDVAGMTTGDGQLSQDGRKRIQAALMQAAYGDSDIVEEMFDSTDTNIKAIGEALKTLAGQWANMRDSAKLGAINPQTDITQNLIQAIGLIRKARRDGTMLYDLVNQLDLMTGETPDATTVGVLRMFYSGQYMTRAVGKDKLTKSLSDYVTAAKATSAGPDMFGDVVTAGEILATINPITEGQGDAEAQPEEGRGQPAGSGDPGVGAGEARTAVGRQRAGESGPGATADRGSEPGQDAAPEAQQQVGQGDQGGQEGDGTGQGGAAGGQQGSAEGQAGGLTATGQSPLGAAPNKAERKARGEGVKAKPVEAASDQPAIDREKLDKDFRTFPTLILNNLLERGKASKLYKAAGTKGASGFDGLTMDDKAAAYVKFVEQGGKPVENLPKDYNAWVRSQERDIEVRRLQSDRVVRQENGKPFKTKTSAQQFQERYDLTGTHEVVEANGGFELRQLSPAAQAELKRKAEGRESYTEAQAAVAEEMGIGQTPDGEWDALDQQQRTSVLLSAGWRTNKGGLSVIGKRLLNTPWEKISDGTRDIIAKNSGQNQAQALDGKAQVATETVAQPITRADVTAAQQQAAAIIGARIDAMTAGEVNTIAKKFLPTMGMKPTMSKANNKAAMTDPKINLEAAAAEVGATLPAEVTRALQADMEGRVADAQSANENTAQSQQTEPNPLEHTPKQYADAWLRWTAETNALPLAEVREMQGDEAGLKAIEQRWVDAVVQEAKSGKELPAKTLDKLLEVRPNAQLPESAIPDGYQRPEARKAEKEEAAARKAKPPARTQKAQAAIDSGADAQGQDVMFSRKGAGGITPAKYMTESDRPQAGLSRGRAGGMTEAAVRQVADTITSRWTQAPTVVVVPNMQDMRVPEAARQEDARQRAAGATGVPRAFYDRGTVYLVADGLRSISDAAEALFHEALGHYGLRAVFGPGLVKVLDDLAAARPDLLRAKAKEYGKDLGSQKERRQVAEEVLAEMAQTRPELGFVRRAIAAIRTWLRENVPYFKDLALTDAEIINNFILPARGLVERGERAMRPGGQIALSRSAMKSVTANIDRGLAPEQSGVVRVIYRGTNDSGERISGGIAEGTLFAAADEATAKNYAGTGGKIERIGVKQDAKVLVEGTKEFAQVTGRRRGKLIDTMRKGENLKTAADDAAAKARAAGYDALEFTSFKDLGIAIFNEDKFVRDYSPAQQLNQSPAFDGPEVGNTPIGDAPEIEVDGVQRPTRNSSGQPIHPTEEGIRNFWRWFSPQPSQLLDGLSVSEIRSLERHTKALADFIERQSSLPKTDRFKVIPRPVLTHMVGVVSNDKILDAVIRSIPVDVVDFLSRKKWSAKEALHDVSVLEDVLAVDPETDVSLGVNPSSYPELAVRLIANAGAKITGLTDGALERNSAVLANENDPVLGAHVAKSSNKDLGILAGFGDSKVVDDQGRPLVVYHGTKGEFTKFDLERAGSKTDSGAWGRGIYFAADPEYAGAYAGRTEGSNIVPAYISLQNPLVVDARERTAAIRGIGLEVPRGDPTPAWSQQFANAVAQRGYDGVIVTLDGAPAEIVAFRPEQVKSATGNSGAFDPANPDIRFSRSTLGNTPPTPPQNPNAWQKLKAKALELTSPDAIESLIYEYQDKNIDLKRLRDHIKELGGTITDLNDAYLGEELYHKRLAKRTQDFLSEELKPLLADMRARGVDMPTLERYLHARHAPEANRVLAERNPNAQRIEAGKAKALAVVKALEVQLQRAHARGTATKAIEQALELALAERDRWTGAQAFKGTEAERLSLSGMSDAEAAAFMGGLPAGQKVHLEALAARVDAIQAKTLEALEKYGLMDKATLGAWRSTYQFYVPLHRDEAHPDAVSHPIGQGFSTKGDASKRRTGSNEKVTNILAHIAMQREAALTRGEKNRVAKKLYLMAAQNPDPEIWSVDKPPMMKTVDRETGFVRTTVDPTYRNKPNVVMVRIGGKDRAITFNERNPKAVRMAQSIRGADVGDLNAFESIMGKATRWLASVNTQYNPIFGIINFARDVQAAILQLSTTPLKGQERAVAAYVPAALKGIYAEVRSRRKGQPRGTGQWAKLWEDMQDEGGTTGYRELFITPDERVKALTKELNALERGKVSEAAHAVVDWLSDYNETMENAVRLAAYKVALDQGMSKERAASLAKNLTVNFNRRGRQTARLGAYYAFLNAAIQGTTRMVETLRGPLGRKIMLGGVMLGAVNALIGMAMMGGDDGEDDNWEKIPDFVKERSLIIPLGREDYLAIPMPLGYHVFPNLGRKAVEMMMHDDPTKGVGSHIAEMLRITLDAFNPLGGSENLAQMVTPTPLDPAVALMMNRDWTGKPIYREDNSSLDPTPGHQRTKDTASAFSKAVSEALNKITGGTDYQPGAVSVTPDQIDYVIGQITGGLGREILKLENSITAPLTGDELPAYKIPLVGRLYGNTRGPANNAELFYEHVRELNQIENEIRGRARDGGDVAGYMAEEPLSALVGMGNAAENQIRKLRQYRAEVVRRAEPGYQDEVKRINEQMGEVMKLLNQEVRRAKQEARH